jgi:hypothetical protein
MLSEAGAYGQDIPEQGEPELLLGAGHKIIRSALGRPKKDEIRNKKQDYIDEAERIEVKRRFSLAKRKCGMGLIMTRLSETVRHTIALSLIVLNLRKVLCAFFDMLAV